jgi:hypothetical protein
VNTTYKTLIHVKKAVLLRAEGRRFAIQCRLLFETLREQTYTDCRTPNQRFGSGASTLTPFGLFCGQESEFPSAFSKTASRESTGSLVNCSNLGMMTA